MTAEEELEILRYFFTWDIEWLKKRKEKGMKFTDENAVIKYNNNVQLYIKDKDED